jgi:hypothetical protein
MALLFTLPRVSTIDLNGLVAGAATLTFYQTGTANPQAVYADSALSVSLGSTVTASDAGLFPTIYLNETLPDYKIVAKDADGSEIWSVDPYINGLTQAQIGRILFKRTNAEISAGITPANYAVPAPEMSIPSRYGAAGDGVANDDAEFQALEDAYSGVMVDLGGKSYAVSQVPNIYYNGTFVISSDDGYRNTAYGWRAFSNNTFVPFAHPSSTLDFASGNYNTAFGSLALEANTTGRRNTALGAETLLSCSTGFYNTAVGALALTSVTSGADNVALGVQAGQFLTTGSENVAIGDAALNACATGEHNVAIGRQAGLVATGSGNTLVGRRAGLAISTGANNVGMGHDALSGNTTGSNNVAIGTAAAGAVGTWSEIVAIGHRAASSNTANHTVAVGKDALFALTSGLTNTAVGYIAGQIETNGNYNTFLGAEAGATQTAGFSNTTCVGYQAACAGNNQITLGNASVAAIRAQVTSITSLSDARFKKNISPLDIPDAFLDEVEIVTFEWAREEMQSGVQTGVIAQQLDALQTKYGLEWLGLVDKKNPDRWEATPHKLLFPLILKTQRLSKRVAALEAK